MKNSNDNHQQRLLKKLHDRQAVIGIVGLGYVGLPLMLRFTEVGYRVIGFDIDPDKVQALGEGRSYIKHIAAGKIAAAVQSGFLPTTDFARARDADALIICVPTPLNKYREPDLSFVTGTMDELVPHLRADNLCRSKVPLTRALRMRSSSRASRAGGLWSARMYSWCLDRKSVV